MRPPTVSSSTWSFKKKKNQTQPPTKPPVTPPGRSRCKWGLLCSGRPIDRSCWFDVKLSHLQVRSADRRFSPALRVQRKENCQPTNLERESCPHEDTLISKTNESGICADEKWWRIITASYGVKLEDETEVTFIRFLWVFCNFPFKVQLQQFIWNVHIYHIIKSKLSKRHVYIKLKKVQWA